MGEGQGLPLVHVWRGGGERGGGERERERNGRRCQGAKAAEI